MTGPAKQVGTAKPAPSPLQPVPELVQWDAIALSHAIRSRQISCREVMTTFLDHIEHWNPKVNAIVSLEPRDALMRQADERDSQLRRGEYCGWMHGFPHAVKDLAPTRGIRSTWGSPLLDTLQAEDAIFVERLRKNGAIIIGKTNVPEFGLGSQTYNPIFGTTLNPYNPSKTVGGSSGGAAAALALRMLPVADGSDMMGSLRNPAAFGNVLGFRVSFGRVPSQGFDNFLRQLFVEGPMGRSVRDTAMLLSVMAGPDPRAPLSLDDDPSIFTHPLERDFRGTRIGWLGDLGGYLPMEPGILELCRTSFKAFESFGCTVEDARIDFPLERMWNSWVTLRHWLVAGDMLPLYGDPAKRAQMRPEMIWELEGSLKLTAQHVYEASVARSDFYRVVTKLFDKCEYLLLPSAQVFPFDAKVHWPKSVDGVAMDSYHRWMEVVVPGSLTALPVIGVPVGFSADKLPMGIQIFGKNHADFAVLQLAYAYEQATHWVRDYPPPMLSSAGG